MTECLKWEVQDLVEVWGEDHHHCLDDEGQIELTALLCWLEKLKSA